MFVHFSQRGWTFEIIFVCKYVLFFCITSISICNWLKNEDFNISTHPTMQGNYKITKTPQSLVIIAPLASFQFSIKLFLNNRNEQILMRGHLTKDILIEQVVPQGDVISPYIFILMVEMLLIKINFSKSVKGINFATDESRSKKFGTTLQSP